VGSHGLDPFANDGAADLLAELADTMDRVNHAVGSREHPTPRWLQSVRASRAVWIALRRAGVPMELPDSVRDADLERLVTNPTDLDGRLLHRMLEREAREAAGDPSGMDPLRQIRSSFAAVGRTALAQRFHEAGAPADLAEWVDEQGFDRVEDIPPLVPRPEWTAHIAIAEGLGTDELARRFFLVVERGLQHGELSPETREPVRQVVHALATRGRAVFGEGEFEATLAELAMLAHTPRHAAARLFVFPIQSIRDDISRQSVGQALSFGIRRFVAAGLIDPVLFSRLRGA
jgi:hypothetical protein